ncbi:unnamed protein product [Durusdinium trenchii]|uniref:Uncharacterized protein n=1 Tax=Durusdinium trenchii TaxID=1381693 RepID=A0ABP0P421_9DINO
MRSGSSAQKYQLTTAQVQETTAGLDQVPPQLVSNSGAESATLAWRIAATVNEMVSAELEDFVANLSKSTCRALQKAIGVRLEAPPEAIYVRLCKLACRKEQQAARGRTEGEGAETSSLAQAQASDRGEEQVAGLPPPEARRSNSIFT